MSRGTGAPAVAGVIAFVVTLAACGTVADPTGVVHGPIIYGSDNRLDYYEVGPSAQRDIGAGAVVALVSNKLLKAAHGQLASAPAWGMVDHLCEDEPFWHQPSAAFCSGVLVDWDLVLTAGHCARAFAVEDFSVVFDFYYEAPGGLAFVPESVAPVAEIVAERNDEAGSSPRLDYAWLRLKRLVPPFRRPVRVHTMSTGLAVGDTVVSMSYGGGIPLKIDSGAVVQDTRADAMDYFTADADNFAGSSGGGAFDDGLALTGVISRGEEDFELTASGCRRATRALNAGRDTSRTFEQFTLASRAVEGLCDESATASSICRKDCGDPCEALPHPLYEGGCTLISGRRPEGAPVIAAILALLSTRLCAGRRRPDR